jgi:hypothetical protein
MKECLLSERGRKALVDRIKARPVEIEHRPSALNGVLIYSTRGAPNEIAAIEGLSKEDLGALRRTGDVGEMYGRSTRPVPSASFG